MCMGSNLLRQEQESEATVDTDSPRLHSEGLEYDQVMNTGRKLELPKYQMNDSFELETEKQPISI